MKKYDIYYASGWFNEEQRKNYDMLTSALKEEFTLFEPRYKAEEAELNEELTLERAREIFQADVKGIDECCLLFADVSFRDMGVLVEIGYALAKEIPVVIFDNSPRPKANCMLAGSSSSCLRDMDDVERWLCGEAVFNLGEIE